MPRAGSGAGGPAPRSRSRAGGPMTRSTRGRGATDRQLFHGWKASDPALFGAEGPPTRPESSAFPGSGRIAPAGRWLARGPAPVGNTWRAAPLYANAYIFRAALGGEGHAAIFRGDDAVRNLLGQ